MLAKVKIFILVYLAVEFGRQCRTTAQENGHRNVTCIAHDTKFICDCQSVQQTLELPPLEGSVYQIDILNCPSLIIQRNTIEMTQGLRRIHVKNVQNLVMLPQAFAFSRYSSSTPLIIEFEDVHFTLIDSHAMSGNIEEISFLRSRIELIKPFGFTTVKDRAVLFRMDGVIVQKLEPQAFKKFAVEEMDIRNCVFNENVPSKAFYEIEILNKMQMLNNKFRKVYTRAFSLTMVSKFVMASNQFEDTEGEWIEAAIRESITLKENNFGITSSIAFKGIHVHRTYVKSDQLELNFLNNTIRCPDIIYPLDFDERFSLNIKYLHYANVYNCQDLESASRTSPSPSNFFRDNIYNIYFLYSADEQDFKRLDHVRDIQCTSTSAMPYVIGGVSALVLVLILIFVSVCVWKARSRKKKQLQKLEIIQPEPRTYTQTQIIYQIENAGLLKTDL